MKGSLPVTYSDLQLAPASCSIQNIAALRSMSAACPSLARSAPLTFALMARPPHAMRHE
jgi:hypothetical protein